MEAQQPLLDKRRKKMLEKSERLEMKMQDEEQAAQVKMRRRLALFTASWVLLGVLAGTQMEGWTLLTSCYVFVQIVTTIGYGDITVADPQMKLFMSFYVMVCILLVAGFFSDLVNQIIKHESNNFVKHLKKAGDKGTGADENDAASQIFKKPVKAGAKWSVIVAGLVFAAFVLAGTLFYGLYENCSCSYGATAIQGCIPNKCMSTGGAVKSWVDCFYMSVITLTTVGFGDHSPKSMSGRVFGCFWMALGVGAFANFVGEFGKVFLTAQRKARIKSSRTIFREMDTDSSGYLTLHEFRVFALLKWGLVEPDQLNGIDKLFEQIDRSGDGHVDFEELQRFCGH